MSVKCRACGFDSADDTQWCDFCKEPFRKKSTGGSPSSQPPQEAAGAAVAPVSAAAQPIDPKVQLLLKQLSAAGDGLTLPKLPPWFKYVAWAVFGSWFVTGAVLGGIMLARYHDQHAAQDSDPTQPHVQIIRTP